MRDSLLEFLYKPILVLNKITRRFEEVSQVNKSLINKIRSVRKETSNSSEKGLIQIIMKKARFVYIYAHTGGLTNCIKDDFEIHPFLKRTQAK